MRKDLPWLRLWNEMPTDPKWRVVARASGRPLVEVIATAIVMFAHASERRRTQTNAAEHGSIADLSNDEIAAGLDLETASVAAIREAMQGKILDGERLSGWKKRQPLREDGAAERAAAHRERKRTQPNARERQESESDIDSTTAGNVTLDELRRALSDSAGRALKPEASHPGLLDLSVPQAWLASDCDLGRDIVPTVLRLASKARPASIASWGYFSDAVHEAREQRRARVGKARASSSGGKSRPRLTAGLRAEIDAKEARK